jgi:spermidine synthase
MGAVNLLAGGIFLLLRERSPGASARSDPAPELAQASPSLGRFAAIALLAGFAAMTLQVTMNRIGALAFGSSHFTFAMVVAVFVLCIAFGSFAVSALQRIPAWLLPATLWAQVLALLILFGVVEDAPYWAHRLRAGFDSDPRGFLPFHGSALGWTFWILAVPVALSGATLPLLFDGLRRESGELGGTAGRLYSWNTAGSLLGAVLGGYVLLFWLDLDQVYRIALVAAALAGALAMGRRGGSLAPAGLSLALALVPIFALPAWSESRLTSGLFRQREALAYTSDGPDAFFARHPLDAVIFRRDDPTATITVAESAGGRDRSIITNGKSDSSARGDYVTTALLALVPALLAERSERAFIVGYGTGVTAGVFASLDSANEVVVAEISRGVIEAADLFDSLNGEVSTDPRVRVDHADAYRSLIRSDGAFDVIISEPSNPWVTGVEMLYSREFLEAARDRLTSGGVFSQWIHTYEIDADSLALVLRTYREVFPHVSVWFTKGNDLQLLGMTTDRFALDVARILERARRPDFARALSAAGVENGVALLAHELLPVGVVHAADLPGELHTLRHPRLAHLAARSFFSGRQAKLPSTAGLELARIGADRSLTRRLARIRGGALSEADRRSITLQTCLHRPPECATLLAAWRHQRPDSAARADVQARLSQRREVIRLPDEITRSLEPLYGAPAPADVDPLVIAREASSRFQLFYHHGEPFSRSALSSLWEACLTDPRTQAECITRRHHAELLLGDLGVALETR